MLTLGLDQENDSHNINDMLFRGNHIYDIKSISLLEGEYDRPIYRYDTLTEHFKVTI